MAGSVGIDCFVATSSVTLSVGKEDTWYQGCSLLSPFAKFYSLLPNVLSNAGVEFRSQRGEDILAFEKQPLALNRVQKNASVPWKRNICLILTQT